MFEDDTEDVDLSDSEMVKGIVMDLDDRKVRDLWKTMDGYDERDYMRFKGSVLEYYLGTKKTATYLLEQLEEFVYDSRDQRLTLQCLSDYQSCFRPMALWLENNSVISRMSWMNIFGAAYQRISEDRFDSTSTCLPRQIFPR